jgi:hypothetical protein
VAQQETLEFNRNIFEHEYPIGEFEVTRELLEDFISGVGETNPRYVDAASNALSAPAAFVGLFTEWLEPAELGLKFEGVDFLGGQWVEPIGPIRPGDVLKCTARVKEVYRKTGRSGPMAFIVMEYRFVNQEGELVSIAGVSHVRRKVD